MHFQYIDQIDKFAYFLDHQDKVTAAFYLIIAKIISGVTFIPGSPLTILSGAVLGVFWGTVVSIIGNLIGAVFAFLIARYLFKDFVQNKILKKYPTINEYEDKLFKRGLHTVIFLRLVPIFPFNFLNFALGVTEVKFKDFMLGSFVGMIPGTIAFVYFGESIKMFSFINLGLSILAIAALFYVGNILRKK